MATEKQTISRHKTATTRAVEPASSSQAFDIIPPNKVRPSASSRPVITQTAPTVPDNTLKTETTAPELNLTHTAPKLDVPTAVTKDDEPKGAPKVESKGVLLSDLVAKREKASAKPDGKEAAEKEAEEPAHDPDKPTAQSDGSTPADAAPDSGTLAAKEAGNDEAAKPDVDAMPAAADAKEEKSDEEQPAEDMPAVSEEPDDDSVEAALKSEDATAEPKEHSDSLKAAMNELDGKDGRPHHELYGGKPVIVIHKHHRTSAGMWLLWFFICLLLALAAVDILLDMNLITTTYNIPHTNFL